MDNIKVGVLRNVSHWNIINHIPYAVYYITLAYLLCNWRLYLLILFTSCPAAPSPPVW